MAAHHTGKTGTIRARLARPLGTLGFAFAACSALIATAPAAQADTIPMVNAFPFAMPWDLGPRIVRLFGSIQPADNAVLLSGPRDTGLVSASRVNQKFGEEWPAPEAPTWPEDIASVQTGNNGTGGWATVDREFTAWP